MMLCENFVSIHNVTGSIDYWGPMFLYLFLGLFVRHGAYSEAISHRLTQKGVFAYFLGYLGHLVGPEANALICVREQD